MRVTLTQSGGIVGAVRTCELDSSFLPPDDARELESLVRSSGLSASGAFLSGEGQNDLRLYEIRIERNSERLAVTFDDHTLPERARPLLSFLRRNAKPRSPE